MQGADIKKLLRSQNILQWRLALEMNISESTLVRWLRGNLNKQQEEAILEAIERIISQKEE